MKPRIAVVGVGGAGGNAINNMIAAGLSGAQFMVANTDAQALAASSAEVRLQLGSNLTEGLGAGSKPEIGEAAAEEALDEIRAAVSGCHMVFIAAGMGGGTGTGAASVIARVANESEILTVAVVTKPFLFEGSRRMRVAEAGIAELRNHVDTLLVIPNQNLFRVATDRTTFAEAFVLADQVLYSGIACIVDLIVKEGLINLDLADVRTVLSGMGTAMMGTGEAAGDQRAIIAAEEAIVNPLLDDVTLKGAKSLLLSITGGPDLTLWEVDEAANRVRQEVDPDANIIVGATFDQALGDRVRVSIVASGMTRTSVLHAQQAQRAAADSARAGPGQARGGRPASDDHRRQPGELNGHAALRGEPQGDPYDAPGRPANSPLASATRPRNGAEAAAEARRHGPRMPSVDDFPPVGQREYWAKQGEPNGRAAQPGLDPISPHAPESPAPKTSLLRRLTGASLGRREAPSAAEPRADDSDHRLGPQFAEDNVDLPVFFGRKKR
jgi:cell division protein FtsZ